MGETEGTGVSAIVQGFLGLGSRRRLPVSLLTTRALTRAHPLARAPHAQAALARRPLLRRDPGTCLAGPRAPDRRLLLARLHLRGALARSGRGDA